MSESNFQNITPLGMYNFRHQQKKFGIKVDDRRRHIYVVGKTGVGKSTLLENMAIADIRSGKGIAIIDPHGELAEKLLDFVPEERLGDVIYFDPSDMEHPFAFNPMEQVGTEFRHLVASGIMSVFKKIWIDAWSARMEYILNNTLLALLEFPNSTLLGILRMFAEPDYRKQIVDNLKDPVIRAFWQKEFARYSQKLETEALAAIQNKVGQFVSNPLIRNILGQSSSTLNMRDIMDTGKIFIVNLSKGKIGEDNSTLLGAMIITRLQLAAMSRVDVPEEKRRDFFMYVDEFQNFATGSFAGILSEARKYHLSLTLAHQYIGQLVTSDGDTKVRDAVFGNVGTIISFRVGATDAEFLEKEFMPEFLQTDLVNLAKANVYVKLMIDGVASRPFSAETMPPEALPLISHRDVIIKNSQEHYGTLRHIVDERIASEWGSPSNVAIEDKMNRQGERRLSEVLRPDFRPSREGSGRSPMRPPSGNNFAQRNVLRNEPRSEPRELRAPRGSSEPRRMDDPASFRENPARSERPVPMDRPAQQMERTMRSARPMRDDRPIQPERRIPFAPESGPMQPRERQAPPLSRERSSAPERTLPERRQAASMNQEEYVIEPEKKPAAKPDQVREADDVAERKARAVMAQDQMDDAVQNQMDEAMRKEAPQRIPKRVPKGGVDIEELRRAINASLKKQIKNDDIPQSGTGTKPGDEKPTGEKPDITTSA